MSILLLASFVFTYNVDDVNVVSTTVDLVPMCRKNRNTFVLIQGISISSSWNSSCTFGGLLDGNGLRMIVDSTFLSTLSSGALVRNVNFVINYNQLITNANKATFYNCSFTFKTTAPVFTTQGTTFENCTMTGQTYFIQSSNQTLFLQTYFNTSSYFINSSFNDKINGSFLRTIQTFSGDAFGYAYYVNNLSLIHSNFYCEMIGSSVTNASCLAYNITNSIIMNSRFIVNFTLSSTQKVFVGGVAVFANQTQFQESDVVFNYTHTISGQLSANNALGGLFAYFNTTTYAVVNSSITTNFTHQLQSNGQANLVSSGVAMTPDYKVLFQGFVVYQNNSIVSSGTSVLKYGGILYNQNNANTNYVSASSSGVYGHVNIQVADQLYYGGFASQVRGNISRCFTNVSVNVSYQTNSSFIGGFVEFGNATFNECISLGYMNLTCTSHGYESSFGGFMAQSSKSTKCFYGIASVAITVQGVRYGLNGLLHFGGFVGDVGTDSLFQNCLVAREPLHYRDHFSSALDFGGFAGRAISSAQYKQISCQPSKMSITDWNNSKGQHKVGGFFGYDLSNSISWVENIYVNTIIDSESNIIGLFSGESKNLSTRSVLIAVTSTLLVLSDPFGTDGGGNILRNFIMDCSLTNIKVTSPYCKTTNEISKIIWITNGSLAAAHWAFVENITPSYPFLKNVPYYDYTKRKIHFPPQSLDVDTSNYYVDSMYLFPKYEYDLCRGSCNGIFVSPYRFACNGELSSESYCYVTNYNQKFEVDTCQVIDAICQGGINYCEQGLYYDDNQCKTACSTACNHGFCNDTSCICDLYWYSSNATDQCNLFNCSQVDSQVCFGQNATCVSDKLDDIPLQCKCNSNEQYLDTSTMKCKDGCLAPSPQANQQCVAPNVIVCQIGYILDGSNCVELTSCNQLSCANGACQNVSGIFQCVCTNLWYGQLCDECDAFGDQCEYSLENCSNQFCSARGSCEKQLNGFKCSCSTGFNDNNCSQCQYGYFFDDCITSEQCALKLCTGSNKCQGPPEAPKCLDEGSAILVYEISDLQQLCDLSSDKFILMNDILIDEKHWNGSCSFVGTIVGNNYKIRIYQQFLEFASYSTFIDIKFELQIPGGSSFIMILQSSKFYKVNFTYENQSYQFSQAMNSVFEQCFFSGDAGFINISFSVSYVSSHINISYALAFIITSSDDMFNATVISINRASINNSSPMIVAANNTLFIGNIVVCNYTEVYQNISCIADSFDYGFINQSKIMMSVSLSNKSASPNISSISQSMNQSYVINSDFIINWAVAYSGSNVGQFCGLTQLINGSALGYETNIENVSVYFEVDIQSSSTKNMFLSAISNRQQKQFQVANFTLINQVKVDQQSNADIFYGGLFIFVQDTTRNYTLVASCLILGEISIVTNNQNIVYFGGLVFNISNSNVTKVISSQKITVTTTQTFMGGMFGNVTQDSTIVRVNHSSINNVIEINFYTDRNLWSFIGGYVGRGSYINISYSQMLSSLLAKSLSSTKVNQQVALGGIIGYGYTNCYLYNNLVAKEALTMRHEFNRNYLGGLFGWVYDNIFAQFNNIQPTIIQITNFNSSWSQRPWVGGIIGLCESYDDDSTKGYFNNNLVKTQILAHESNTQVGLFTGHQGIKNIELRNNIFFVVSMNTTKLTLVGSLYNKASISFSTNTINCDLTNINQNSSQQKYATCKTGAQISNPSFMTSIVLNGSIWFQDVDFEVAHPCLRDNIYLKESDMLLTLKGAEISNESYYNDSSYLFPITKSYNFCRGVCRGQYHSIFEINCTAGITEDFCYKKDEIEFHFFNTTCALFENSTCENDLIYCNQSSMSNNKCHVKSGCPDGCGKGKCVNNSCLCDPYFKDGTTKCSVFQCDMNYPHCYGQAQCFDPAQPIVGVACKCFSLEQFLNPATAKCEEGCPGLLNGYCIAMDDAVCDKGYQDENGSLCSKCAFGYINESGKCVTAPDCSTVKCSSGKCSMDSGLPLCQCFNLWTGTLCNRCNDFGENCTIPQAQCKIAHCNNRGTCVGQYNRFSCSCDESFAGASCQNCALGYFNISNTCLNPEKCGEQKCNGNGICEGQATSFVCTCNENFTTQSSCSVCVTGKYGENCTSDGVSCGATTCFGNGNCSGTVAAPICICEYKFDIIKMCEKCIQGYKGSDCKQCDDGYTDNDGVCVLLTCNGIDCGHGQCSLASGFPVCVCDNLWHGSKCDYCTDYGDNCNISQLNCDANECKDSGRCEGTHSLYQCVCNAGYAGATCDQCSSTYYNVSGKCLSNISCGTQICNGKGVCVGVASTPLCQCIPNFLDSSQCKTCVAGFFGLNCALSQVDCDLSCGSNKKCTGDPINYVCTCKPDTFLDSCLNASTCGISQCSEKGVCYGSQLAPLCLCSGNFNHSSQCQSCNTGYESLNCDKCSNGYHDVSSICMPFSCDELKCSNGECQIVSGNPKCICQNHWSGTLCDSCMSFFGPTCNMTTIQCGSSECNGKGSCVGTYNSYSCQCEKEYQGVQCSSCAEDYFMVDGQAVCSNAATCGLYACNGKGQCIGISTSPQCICNGQFSEETNCKDCKFGFFGSQCALTQQACDLACNSANKQCVGALIFECKCKLNTYLDNCITQQSCNTQVCNGGGVCYGSSTTPSCQCNSINYDPASNCSTCQLNYTGVDCKSCAQGFVDVSGICVVADCQSYNCKNGASCRMQNGKPVCNCINLWDGLLCDNCPVYGPLCNMSTANECRKAMCSDKGNCSIGSNTVCKCDNPNFDKNKQCSTCVGGFFGKSCELSQAQCDATCGTDKQCGGDPLSPVCGCKKGQYLVNNNCLDQLTCNAAFCFGRGACSGAGNDPVCECTVQNADSSTQCRLCKTGLHGDGCDLTLDQCRQLMCNSNGQCVVDSMIEVCLCDDGFSGDGCQKSTNKANVGLIVGIVVGVVILLIALSVGLYFILRKKPSPEKSGSKSEFDQLDKDLATALFSSAIKADPAVGNLAQSAVVAKEMKSSKLNQSGAQIKPVSVKKGGSSGGKQAPKKLETSKAKKEEPKSPVKNSVNKGKDGASDLAVKSKSGSKAGSKKGSRSASQKKSRAGEGSKSGTQKLESSGLQKKARPEGVLPKKVGKATNPANKLSKKKVDPGLKPVRSKTKDTKPNSVAPYKKPMVLPEIKDAADREMKGFFDAPIDI